MLQQTIFEYEKQLSNLDHILRAEDSKDAVIFELKKMSDNQL